MGGDNIFSFNSCDSLGLAKDASSSLSIDGQPFIGDDSDCAENDVNGNMPLDQRRKRLIYKQVLESYHQVGNFQDAKNRILSYTPGSWIENVGGLELDDFEVPELTTLVVVGPKCSGKSSLINTISKVFEEDKFISERTQVTFTNSSVGEGTGFLQECMIPRDSKSFCLYDTRSLSDELSENVDMIKQWITKGVRHGDPVLRRSDGSSLRSRIKCKSRENSCGRSRTRKVNFFIFVVNGLEVLKSLESDDDVVKDHNELLTSTFHCPYLSFKDDKPVVVVTHGDLLSLADRARVRTHLGELLGVPPMKQIFDISESCDPENKLMIADMLCCCLEHADKNLPIKNRTKNKVFGLLASACVCILLLGIAFQSVYLHMHVHHQAFDKQVSHDDTFDKQVHRGCHHGTIDKQVHQHVNQDEALHKQVRGGPNHNTIDMQVQVHHDDTLDKQLHQHVHHDEALDKQVHRGHHHDTIDKQVHQHVHHDNAFDKQVHGGYYSDRVDKSNDRVHHRHGRHKLLKHVHPRGHHDTVDKYVNHDDDDKLDWHSIRHLWYDMD